LLDLLVVAGYNGVVTIEVFSERDFFSSREMVLSLVEARQ
jgi:sugar phosphate isomerase/epimerase